MGSVLGKADGADGDENWCADGSDKETRCR